MSTVFSGIRPSGRLHIGNYLGAIKNWIDLQKNYDCIYAVVDYHAITTPFDPKKISEDTRKVLLDYLAAGVDPKKSLLVIQSHIPQHTELAWILSAITPLSWFERVPTYKEKVNQHKKDVTLGLLSYPALMAADILIYKATHVPIGQDQLPHIELTNQIARRFNSRYGKLFAEVTPILAKQGAKILSLTDPTRKMSKTGDEGVGLNDSPDEIRTKVKKAVTDSGTEIIFDPEHKPAISNLLTTASIFSGKDIKQLTEDYRGKGYTDFKNDLAEIYIEKLRPFREKRKEFEKSLEDILNASHQEAQKRAQKTLDEVKRAIGVL